MKFLDHARERLKNSPLFVRAHASYPLAFGLVIAVLCWFAFFAVVVDYIAGDLFVQTDLRIISLLQTLRQPIFNQVMLFFTYLGNWQIITVGSIVFSVLLYVSRQWWWLGAFVTSILGEQLLSQTAKFAFHRDRPNLENALLPAAGGSFPSGHALVAFAFYGFLACYGVSNTRSWWAKFIILCSIIPLILGIGFSRIYLGVHWPSDVIASFALGPAWVATVLIVFSLAWNPAAQASIPPLSRRLALAGAVVWLGTGIGLYLTHPLITHVTAPP
jgi:undecaprenyl-diphosphatase